MVTRNNFDSTQFISHCYPLPTTCLLFLLDRTCRRVISIGEVHGSSGALEEEGETSRQPDLFWAGGLKNLGLDGAAQWAQVAAERDMC